MKNVSTPVKLLCAALIICMTLFVEIASAATLTVNSTGNSGAGTLRDQVSAAAAGDTILFDASINTTPIVISGYIAFNKNLTFIGNGVSNTIIESSYDRLTIVDPGVTISMSGITMQNLGGAMGGGVFLNRGTLYLSNCDFKNNTAIDGAVCDNDDGTFTAVNCGFYNNSVSSGGGGVLYNYQGALSFTNCTFANNVITGSSTYGGAITNFYGPLIINNCTFTGNNAGPGGLGGAIFQSSSTLTINHSTFTKNIASKGGAIELQYGYITVNNSILAGDTAATGPEVDNLGGSSYVTGTSYYNLIGDNTNFGMPVGIGNLLGTGASPIDPMLDTLANNGGATLTMAISSCSPAYNAADPTDNTADQRGSAVFDGRKDIGAYESQVTNTLTITCPPDATLHNITGSCSATLLPSCAPQSGFAGNYAPVNWTFYNTNGGTGSINTTAAPDSIILTGSDNGSGNPSSTNYEITSTCGGVLSFDWSYTTSDESPQYDYFGYYILNGSSQILVNTSGSNTQNGSFSITLAPGDVFGFSIYSVDNEYGAATITISNFSMAPSIPSVTATCGIDTIYSDAPAVFPVGVTAVKWTAISASGDTATCTQNVTVNDVDPPTIICPAAISVSTDSNQCTASNVVLGIPTVSDNCGVDTVINNAPAVFPKGVTTVTWTAIDIHGNVTTCTQLVTVIDSIAPIAVCQNATIYLDAYGNASLNPADIDGGSSDNCGIASVSASQTSFSCINAGANSVTLTVTDSSGNSSSCTATVTVLDTIAPAAVCQNAIVYLDANGNATLNPADIDGGSSDNCGIASVSASQTSFSCADEGTNSVTLTVTDSSGNSSSCTATVTVLDTIAPVAVCRNAMVYLDANGNASISAVDLDGGSSDNCGIASVSASQTSFSCADAGANSVTLTVTDSSGNSSSCTATVTVLDTIAPAAVCQNATVYLDANGNATLNPADLDGGSSDNCGIASVSASQTSFSCADAGANSVTLTVTDSSGNSSSCTATVTVLDTIAPAAVCQNETIYLDANGNAILNPADIDGGSSDNCGIASVSTSQSSFSCANVGANPVTLTVTDSSGNSSSCSATVTVLDTIAPAAVCQNAMVYLDANGNATLNPADLDAGSSDNCGIASVSASQTSFSCADAGANSVTLTVTDSSGNSSSCTATVTVLDTIVPVAVCQNATVYLDANGNASISAVDLDGGSSDNCGIASVSASQTSFSCANAGANSVTLTVTDSSGNSSSCTATVTVLDTLAPTITCPSDVVVSADAGQCSASNVSLSTPTAMDNCGIDTVINDAPSVFPVGSTTVTWTATDIYGNSVSCVQMVTVNSSIDTSVTFNGTTFTANESGAAYQWYNCTTNTNVAGANGQAFSPSATGSYALIISQGNCSDTSSCFDFVYTSIGNPLSENRINVFPNPATDLVNIQSIGKFTGAAQIQLYDLTGQLVRNIRLNSMPQMYSLSLNGLASEVYELRIQTPQGAWNMKVMKVK